MTHPTADGTIPQRDAEYPRLSATLAASIDRWTRGATSFDTDIPGLHFSRWEHPTDPTRYTLGPSVCLIAQGAKRVMVGEDTYVYDADHFLVTSVDLPVVAQIVEATAEQPYLGAILKVDQQVVTQLMVDSNLPPLVPRRTDRGIGVSRLPISLLKAMTRLVELQDAPESIPILAPLITKEIMYHLLTGPQGPRLRQIVISGTHGHQIARAIEWLKRHFRQTTSVDELAERANMSRSAFYHHFRSMTSLSPLQYRKHLQLQEARRLMVVDQVDATTAALDVGYESPSQFNREYRRLFGRPPAQDAAHLRDATRVGTQSHVLTG
tara:strand:+ start:804 stop:1772 length:969 start_codon:yes stop_codon:yes gene_type:complete